MTEPHARDHLADLPPHAPRGVYGAVLLAIDEGGDIDWNATRETISRLCAAELDGIYSNGTACEFHSQTEAEFDRLSSLVAEVAALRERVPSLAGAKLPAGDANWYEEMRRLLPGFSVFVPGHTLATGHKCGAHGSYSNVACLSPTGAAVWWRQIRADPACALAVEARIQRFMTDAVLPFRARYRVSDAALDKAMATAGGWAPIGPRLLWPYSSVPQAEIPALARAARAALPDWWQ